MSLYKVEAIIIKARNLGEADKFLTLFTREFGKVEAVAKGVRKIKSKNRGSVQLFSCTNVMLYRGKNLDTVTQCQLLEGFPSLRNDLDRLAYAAYFVQLVDLLLPERERNEEVFFLLLTSLHLLAHTAPQLPAFNNEAMEIIARQFEVKLINILGYRPELDCCVGCNTPLHTGNLKFSNFMGGVLCPLCGPNDLNALDISRGTIAILKQLEQMNVRNLHRLKLAPRERKHLEVLLNRYLEHLLEQKLKTVDFIRGIKNILVQ